MNLTDLTEDDLEAIQFELEDYQITHGSLFKIPRTAPDLDDPTVAIARPVGVSLIPTTFPHLQFKHALFIQPIFNELYVKIAEDEPWLEGIIHKLLETDPFAKTLWQIWERVKSNGEVQPVRCGIFRSDYMLHRINDRGNAAIGQKNIGATTELQIKQVEFNTYSCAGASHANIVTNMHRYLGAKGAHRIPEIQLTNLPKNNAIKEIAASLEAAHRIYDQLTETSWKTVILMTVQPENVNICDERPIEYSLSDCDPPIPLYRVEFSNEVMQRCHIGPKRELLFTSPRGGEVFEVSVVYQRAGYDPGEYTPQGIEARYMLEASRAIKCPTILSHISGFKKVQQELTKPGVLERFVSAENADALRRTFMPLYAFDTSEDGVAARKLALDENSAAMYILKPSLDGGGHNIYGKDIPSFLARIPQHTWSRYILMERINARLMQGVLISPLMTHRGLVVSELGAIGTCLWRREAGGGRSTEILGNASAGWTFKTKPSDVDEMSVVKGYGCFDCPLFLDAFPGIPSGE
ncbi:glutathione synthetase [Biscogniauxia mediterranea]|nr:glutathione synthetase [Biscogniauxia mediterranea]